jgi:autotransporter-associated beta strand protein
VAIQYAYNSNVAAGALTLSGGITLDSTSTLDAVRSGGLIDVTGAITGAGGLTIASSASSGGVVRLSGSNTYGGNTTISGGILAAATSTALGSGSVSIGSGASLRLDPGAIVSNAITTTSTGSILFAGGGLQRTSSQPLLTVAQLVAGGTGASVALDPAFAWSAPIAGVTYSDVLDLTNTHGTIQILQMTYDESLIAGGSESDILLGWNSSGSWVNAIDGNIGSSGGSSVTNASGSYASLGILSTADYLGSWGRDTTTNTVWAVVNHNSEYASVVIVPEPGAFSLAGVGLALVCWTAARRRCRSAR